MPPLRVSLLTGGVPARDQLEQLKRGVHIVVATPGRLMDLLEKKLLSLQLCRYLVSRMRCHLVDDLCSLASHAGPEQQQQQQQPFAGLPRRTLLRLSENTLLCGTGSRRGGPYGRHGLRGGRAHDHLALRWTAADAPILGHNASKDPELRAFCARSTCERQRRKSRRSFSERHSGSLLALQFTSSYSFTPNCF